MVAVGAAGTGLPRLSTESASVERTPSTSSTAFSIVDLRGLGVTGKIRAVCHPGRFGMTRMGLLAWVTLSIALTSTPACAQDSTAAPSWTFSASLWGYLVPDQSDYLQPTFIANH